VILIKIYLDKVLKDNKDILYRLLQYTLFEESLNDGNEMNNDGYLNTNILKVILALTIEMHFLLENKILTNY